MVESRSALGRGVSVPVLLGVGRLHYRIWRHMIGQGIRGATCDEVQAALGLDRKNASARIAELSGMGRIVKTKRKRTTRSQREAFVWRALEPREGDREQMCLFEEVAHG